MKTGISQQHMDQRHRTLDIRDTSSFILTVTSSLGLLCDLSSVIVAVLMVLPWVLTEEL